MLADKDSSGVSTHNEVSNGDPTNRRTKTVGAAWVVRSIISGIIVMSSVTGCTGPAGLFTDEHSQAWKRLRLACKQASQERNWAKCEQLGRAALSEAEQLRNRSDGRLAVTEEFLGEALLKNGKYDAAANEFKRAIRLYRRMPENLRTGSVVLDHANALTGLGRAYMEIGRPLRAQEFFQKALALYDAAGTAQSAPLDEITRSKAICVASLALACARTNKDATNEAALSAELSRLLAK